MDKKLTTFEREMKNAKFKKAFDKSYKEFLIALDKKVTPKKSKKIARQNKLTS